MRIQIHNLKNSSCNFTIDKRGCEFVWAVNFGQDPMKRTDDTRVEISRSAKDHGTLNTNPTTNITTTSNNTSNNSSNNKKRRRRNKNK